MQWIKKGIQQPVVTLLLFIALSLAGVFSYFEQVRWYFPHSNRPITRSIQNKKPYVRILGIGFYNSNG
ncbi:hypothetical protein PG301_08880 [Parageobacillus sp. G301]|nr:hypothetical protein PG301_08880 [Parageobacillus sp. G301]